MFAILLLESHRNQCVLIGEDLGTVPPEIRDNMEKHEILRMYVQIRSIKPESKQALKPEPENCIASMNTHDMPPFAAFWKSLDYLDRIDLGLSTRAQYREKKAAREKLQKFLLTHLRAQKFLARTAKDLKSIMTACLHRLAAGKAKAVIVNVEDLWLETKQQNVPATWKERPNWRRKLRFSLEELVGKKELAATMQLVRAIRDKGMSAVHSARKR
jgi:4-alpha-glucanotransferase